MSSLKHENIVVFKKIFETKHYIFLEMEHVKGGQLTRFIKLAKEEGRAIEERTAAKIIKGILNGVNYIHQLNYIHRDLKPENILLLREKSTPQESPTQSPLSRTYDANALRSSASQRSQAEDAVHIKIVDFGLSTVFKTSLLHNVAEKVGTLLYMAPEQSSYQNYGKKIDVWPIGIIMYILLAGEHPFYQLGDTEETFLERLRKPQKWNFDPERFTPLAQDLCSKLANYNPLARYEAARALRHPWIIDDPSAPIPLTRMEEMAHFELETVLRKIFRLALFL